MVGKKDLQIGNLVMIGKITKTKLMDFLKRHKIGTRAWALVLTITFASAYNRVNFEEVA